MSQKLEMLFTKLLEYAVEFGGIQLAINRYEKLEQPQSRLQLQPEESRLLMCKIHRAKNFLQLCKSLLFEILNSITNQTRVRIWVN
jgi:hypothetical protein